MLLAVLGFYIVGVGAIDDPKKHKDTFLFSYFCVTKSTKSQKEESIPLLISFCRLAATGANTLPRPSDYSIAAATGSKRSSADSDSLLCHVRLWRTSRLSFWRKYGCEHSEIGFVSAIYCSNTSSTAIAVPLLPLEKANSYFRQRRYQTHARHALSAGVQAMRARICSAFSCAVFARVGI